MSLCPGIRNIQLYSNFLHIIQMFCNVTPPCIFPNTSNITGLGENTSRPFVSEYPWSPHWKKIQQLFRHWEVWMRLTETHSGVITSWQLSCAWSRTDLPWGTHGPSCGGICPSAGSGNIWPPDLWAIDKARRKTRTPPLAHTDSCDISMPRPCVECPKIVFLLMPKSLSVCTHPAMTTWNLVLPSLKAICPNKERVSSLVCGTDKVVTETVGPGCTCSQLPGWAQSVGKGRPWGREWQGKP